MLHKTFSIFTVDNLNCMKHILLPDSKERKLVFYLAMEEFLAREDRDEEAFFIWQVAPTVICGRNQNIEAEVNIDYCRKHHINIFRRKSGGGCVYADRGNLMLTWITHSDGAQQTFDRCLQRLAKLINDTGAPATVSGRNDILIGGRKVSGNAFYQTPVKSIVHGTLLYNTDFERLTQAITPPQSKTESKGVASVRQRVTNLSEHTDWSEEEVKKHFVCSLCDGERMLTAEEIETIECIEATYLTEDFLWGKNPPCNLTFDGRIEGVGNFSIRFGMQSGKIQNVALEGDFFSIKNAVPILESCLKDCPVQENAFREALKTVDLGRYILNLKTEDWIELIFNHARQKPGSEFSSGANNHQP